MGFTIEIRSRMIEVFAPINTVPDRFVRWRTDDTSKKRSLKKIVHLFINITLS